MRPAKNARLYSGSRSIYAKKPDTSLAYTMGINIRFQQSDLWVALVGAMGANAG